MNIQIVVAHFEDDCWLCITHNLTQQMKEKWLGSMLTLAQMHSLKLLEHQSLDYQSEGKIFMCPKIANQPSYWR